MKRLSYAQRTTLRYLAGREHESAPTTELRLTTLRALLARGFVQFATTDESIDDQARYVRITEQGYDALIDIPRN